MKFLEAIGTIIFVLMAMGGIGLLIVISGAAIGAENWKDVWVYFAVLLGWFLLLWVCELIGEHWPKNRP